MQKQSETFLTSSFIRFPIFEGGRLRANIAAAEARQSAAAIEYERVVLFALQETETALIRYTKEQETRASLHKVATSLSHSSQLVSSLYDLGISGLLDVLSAERDLAVAQDVLVQSETRVLLHLISLYKALGGGWERDPQEGI